MKNILFIQFDYPPILAPESIQTQRRAISLANMGHRITVITGHNGPKYEYLDDTLLETHENINIIKTKQPYFESSLNIACKLIGIDRKLWWYFYAIESAMKIIESNSIDIVYSHSNSIVNHFVGLFLKVKYKKNIKWISHFSDPWSLNPYVNYNFVVKKMIHRYFENKILKNCDKLIVTSKKTKELFINEFSYLEEKTYILPHTFDQRLYTLSKKDTDNQNKIVVHTGNIYGLRTIKYFLEALKEYKPKNIEFHFYGKIKDSELNLVNKFGLEDVVKIYSQIPYLDSLNVISSADFLMVIDAQLLKSPFFPSKLADYIGAKKPIIALTPLDSASVDILNHIKNNKYIASSENKEDIKKIFKNLEIEDGEYVNIDFYNMNNFDLLKDIFEK